MHFDHAFPSENAFSDSGHNQPTLTFEVAEPRPLKNGEFVADGSTLLIPLATPVARPYLLALTLTHLPTDVSMPASHALRAGIATKAARLSCANPPLPQAP